MSKKELPPEPEKLPGWAVDAHTHLDACGASTRDEVRAMVDRAERAGVGRVVTVADDIPAAEWVAQAAEWDERVFAAVALHPNRAKDFDEQAQSTLEELAKQSRVVAIGETGLDYYWGYSSVEDQQESFGWHIELAKRSGKALMIHDRDAHQDVLAMLRSQGAPSTVVFHCFSGDVDFARSCVDAGYFLSFAGTATFRNANAKELREAASFAPLDHMVVETDAPFLTPHPFRGRPNEPYCVNYTLRDLAELRDVSLDQLVAVTTANAERVFGLAAA